MTLAGEKYVATSTYRKNGEAVSTATWIVGLGDGRLAFWTSSATGKAKRLRNTPRLTLQPSDSRGRAKAGSTPLEGTVTLSTAGPEFDEVQSKVRAKYGIQVPITRLLNRIGHLGKGKFPYGDVVVVVTPDFAYYADYSVAGWGSSGELVASSSTSTTSTAAAVSIGSS